MKTSPRRPLILKRRRLPLTPRDAPRDAPQEMPKEVPRGSPARPEVGPAQAAPCDFPAGIKIANHPTMPNTQVVAVPSGADVQSVIKALSARGKEGGGCGPNKFILVSCGPRLLTAGSDLKGAGSIGETPGAKPEAAEAQVPAEPGKQSRDSAGSEPGGRALDSSLTSMQWLRRMSSEGLAGIKQEQEDGEEKENRPRGQSHTQVAPWLDSVSERPPYSYMAMIQFAINSTERKRMTLKDIYSWIEDHFPYFKHVAKPGWKNSIRHNLSLHDMFVRETSANGKVSFWTIHPSANRYLTLDQVFKQQKQANPDLRRNMGITAELPLGTRRKMKPLLPRVSSYLVPVQFPVPPPLVLQPPVKVPLPLAAPLMGAGLARHSKRARIAPKVLLADDGVAPLPPTDPGKQSPPLERGRCPLPPLRPVKAESPPLEEWPSPCPSLAGAPSRSPTPGSGSGVPKGPKSPASRVSDLLVIRRREGRRLSRSRRKQRLWPGQPLRAPEPGPPEGPPPVRTPGEAAPSRTPVKDSSPPASSTPGGPARPPSPASWRLTPGGLAFSPVRTPPPAALGPAGPGASPLHGVPLFDSPRELLDPEPFAPGPFGGGAPEPLAAPGPPAGRPLAEGLVLDTMNDSLSKILLDVGFPGLDEEPPAADALGWARLLPELH